MIDRTLRCTIYPRRGVGPKKSIVNRIKRKRKTRRYRIDGEIRIAEMDLPLVPTTEGAP
jgi:hypothetical protein